MAPRHLTTALLTSAVAVAHGFTAQTPGPHTPLAAGWAGRGLHSGLRTRLGADQSRPTARGGALRVLEIDETSSGLPQRTKADATAAAAAAVELEMIEAAKMIDSAQYESNEAVDAHADGSRDTAHGREKTHGPIVDRLEKSAGQPLAEAEHSREDSPYLPYNNPIHNTEVTMEKLKAQPVEDIVGNTLKAINPKLLRIWTKADYLHAHAVSGVVFLGGGTLWQASRVRELFEGGHAGMGELAADSSILSAAHPLAFLLLFNGLVNGLTAIPMSQFSSNKMFDLSDLKGNGFSLGGTGLTTMCLWMAWWFSGKYPGFLHEYDQSLVAVFSLLCVATTVNWEVMVQQNFNSGAGDDEANQTTRNKKKKKSRQDRKMAGVDDGSMTSETLATKKWLYRVASWPNLTQILFMSSIAFGGLPWLEAVSTRYPDQARMLYDYSFASALGYSFSMFAETLRDRKLIGLQVDFICLMLGVVAPMGVVALDTVASHGGAAINPLDYWYIFGNFHPEL